MVELSRRLLLGAGSGGLTALATARWAQAVAAQAPFVHGVASGDPLPDGVMLWTRVTPSAGARPGSGVGPPTRVDWEIARDRRFERIVSRGTKIATTRRDHTVHVDVRGLRAGTTYWYRFHALGETSRIGRTKAAPAHDSRAAVRLAVMSCANYDWGYFAGYRHLARRGDLDAVLHLGDYIYEYGPEGPLLPGVEPAKVREARPRHECTTLADYRVRHGCYKLDDDLQELHAAHPMIAVWDDHETANDTWRNGAENHQPEEGSWPTRARGGRRAWLDWLPVRHVDPDDFYRIQRRLRFGEQVDLWMLDERRFRDEPPQSAQFSYGSVDPAVNDPERTMLGDAQRHWLTRGLSRSTATWKVLGNQVPFFPLVLGAGVPEAIQAILEPIEHQLVQPAATAYVDDWNGYAAERAKLIRGMADIDDVVVLTGDVHQSFATDLPASTGDYRLDERSVAVEFVAPGISSPSVQTAANQVMPGSGDALDAVLTANLTAGNPWVKYSEGFHTGYAIVDFDERRVHCDYWHLTDARKRDSDVSLAASWECLRGSRAVTEADKPLD